MLRKTFEVWIKEVDAHIVKKVGLYHDDLPDCLYHDWYEDGVSPSSAASRAIRSAKEY